jgi:hypothetical protein
MSKYNTHKPKAKCSKDEKERHMAEESKSKNRHDSVEKNRYSGFGTGKIVVALQPQFGLS